MERTAEEDRLLELQELEREAECGLYEDQGRPANCDATECWWHPRHGQQGAVELCYWFLLKPAWQLMRDQRRVADYCAAYRECEGCAVCRKAVAMNGAPTGGNPGAEGCR